MRAVQVGAINAGGIVLGLLAPVQAIAHDVEGERNRNIGAREDVHYASSVEIGPPDQAGVRLGPIHLIVQQIEGDPIWLGSLT